MCGGLRCLSNLRNRPTWMSMSPPKGLWGKCTSRRSAPATRARLHVLVRGRRTPAPVQVSTRKNLKPGGTSGAKCAPGLQYSPLLPAFHRHCCCCCCLASRPAPPSGDSPPCSPGHRAIRRAPSIWRASAAAGAASGLRRRSCTGAAEFFRAEDEAEAACAPRVYKRSSRHGLCAVLVFAQLVLACGPCVLRARAAGHCRHCICCSPPHPPLTLKGGSTVTVRGAGMARLRRPWPAGTLTGRRGQGMLAGRLAR